MIKIEEDIRYSLGFLIIFWYAFILSFYFLLANFIILIYDNFGSVMPYISKFIYLTLLAIVVIVLFPFLVGKYMYENHKYFSTIILMEFYETIKEGKHE